MSRCCRRQFLGFAVLAGAAGPGSLIAAPKKQHTILIKNFVFNPEVLNVSIGDVITFVNEDIVPHTATATDNSWDTEEIKTGGSASVVVTESLIKEYYCIYHPMMKGTFKVKE